MKIKIRNSIELIGIVVLLLVLNSCKSSATVDVDKNKKQEYAAVKELVASKQYFIDLQSAQPFATAATTQVLNELAPYRNGSTSGNIQLVGENYFLKVTAGKVTANMPFFGQQLQGSGGNRNSQDVGIDMNGLMEDYAVTEIDRKQRVEIYFEADDVNNSSENYQVLIKVFPNKRVILQVTSSQRTVMQYRGAIAALPDAS